MSDLHGQEAEIAAAFAGSYRANFDFGSGQSFGEIVDEFMDTHKLDYTFNKTTSASVASSIRTIQFRGHTVHINVSRAIPPGFQAVREIAEDERVAADYHKELYYAWRKLDEGRAAEHLGEMYKQIGVAAIKERSVVGAEQASPFSPLKARLVGLPELKETAINQFNESQDKQQAA